MGAWGTGNFENDGALDWICELEPPKSKLFGLRKTDPLAYCRKPVDEVLKAEDWIDSEDGVNTLACGECIAALCGSPGEDLPEEVIAWVALLQGVVVSDADRQRVIEAIKRVRNAEKSELRDLWTELQDDKKPDPEWLAAIDDLLKRLGA